MSYSVSGSFIEACDCRVICPCWINQDPDNGSCTGLFAWSITEGTVDGTPVDGLTVVSVSTHLDNRADPTNAVSVLYIDTSADDDQFARLTDLFSGTLEGPVADIVSVIGSAPIAVDRATITFVADQKVSVLPHDATQEVVTTTIEQVQGADGQQTTIAHQALDPSLAELKVARNSDIDIAVPYPGQKPGDVLEGTMLFDFTQPHYSASSGPFVYQH